MICGPHHCQFALKVELKLVIGALVAFVAFVAVASFVAFVAVASFVADVAFGFVSTDETVEEPLSSINRSLRIMHGLEGNDCGGNDCGGSHVGLHLLAFVCVGLRWFAVGFAHMASGMSGWQGMLGWQGMFGVAMAL